MPVSAAAFTDQGSTKSSSTPSAAQAPPDSASKKEKTLGEKDMLSEKNSF